MDTYFTGDNPFADTKLGNALTRAIVETIHEPFLVLDNDLRIVVASRSFYDKFQMNREEVQGRLFYEIGGRQYDIPALRYFLKNVVPEHSVMRQYKIVHDFANIGQRTLFLSAREVVYENSAHKYLLLSMADMTGQELLDTERERLSKKKDLMIQEMKHRIANSLQLIASILILKSESVESLEARTTLQDAHERIMSIATIEKNLDTASLDEEIEVGPYLKGLCESLSQSMIGDIKPIRLTVVADGGMVVSAEAISLGLITAELVINALKHAFPADRPGTITVSYKTPPDGWSLSVSDDGVGIDIDPVRKVGLGTSIVQSLAHQLGAVVETQTSAQGTHIFIHRVSKAKGSFSDETSDLDV
jgi:two-component sensor histidine kinase